MKSTLDKKLFEDSNKGNLFSFVSETLRIEIVTNGEFVSALVFIFEEEKDEKCNRKISKIFLLKAEEGLSHE